MTGQAISTGVISLNNPDMVSVPLLLYLSPGRNSGTSHIYGDDLQLNYRDDDYITFLHLR